MIYNSLFPSLSHCSDELLRPNEDKVRIGSRDPMVRRDDDLPVPKNLLGRPDEVNGVAEVVADGAGPSL